MASRRRRCVAHMFAPAIVQRCKPFARAGSVANLQEAMPPTRTHLEGAYPLAFFLPFKRGRRGQRNPGVETMKQVIRSLRSGNWKALLACFFVLRYWIYGLGNVRAAGSVCLQAAVAITDSGWVF